MVQLIVVHDYRGYRIEIVGPLVDGAWNAGGRCQRLSHRIGTPAVHRIAQACVQEFAVRHFNLERGLKPRHPTREPEVMERRSGALLAAPKEILSGLQVEAPFHGAAEEQPRQGFVEEGDFRTIAANLEPGPALAAMIAFETAWRIRSGVLTLEWSGVDLAESCIRLDGSHSKNGKPRTAYLFADTARRLGEYRESVARQLGAIPTAVFAHVDKGPLQGQPIRKFRKAWATACRKAGYAGTLLHDLRRSGVRSMVRAGVPESVAMRISGHVTAQVFKRYDITSDQDLRDARDRRAQFGHTQAGKVVSIAR